MHKILFLLIILTFIPNMYASYPYIRETSLVQKDLLPAHVNKKFIELIKNTLSDNNIVTLSKDYIVNQQRSTRLTKTNMIPFITQQTVRLLLKNALSSVNITTRTFETMNNIQSCLVK